jgi:hypothetical protein
MVALLAMAALAVDLVTLYTARSEAQSAADAVALAGAQAFVTSGFTTGGLGDPTTSTTQQILCTGTGSGLAEKQALAVAAQNLIAGATANVPATSCNFANPLNPQITATVQRTGLPTFFSRIFGALPNSVTVTATAEAFNPSGQAIPVQVQVGSVKPWAVPNCDPTAGNTVPSNPNCGTAGYFLDPANNYAVAHPTSVVGEILDMPEWDPLSSTQPPTSGAGGGNPATVGFLATDIPITPNSASCPSSAAISCNGISGSSPGYDETIACANSIQLSCGQTLNVNPSSGKSGSPPGSQITGQRAALCLTHASTTGPSQGQDVFCGGNGVPPPICPAGSPIEIDGGTNNPNPALQGVDFISRSDSVVTVPVWDPPCSGGACTGDVTIVGFLQLGILRVRAVGSHPLRAVVLNVVGCGSAGSGTAISGGGLSPIPVRLVH